MRGFKLRDEMIWAASPRNSGRTEIQTQVCLKPTSVLFLYISLYPPEAVAVHFFTWTFPWQGSQTVEPLFFLDKTVLLTNAN